MNFFHNLSKDFFYTLAIGFDLGLINYSFLGVSFFKAITSSETSF